MGRKSKFSKETKINACKKYMSGNGTACSIAKEIGCSDTIIRKWYYDYKSRIIYI